MGLLGLKRAILTAGAALVSAAALTVGFAGTAAAAPPPGPPAGTTWQYLGTYCEVGFPPVNPQVWYDWSTPCTSYGLTGTVATVYFLVPAA